MHWPEAPRPASWPRCCGWELGHLSFLPPSVPKSHIACQGAYNEVAPKEQNAEQPRSPEDTHTGSQCSGWEGSLSHMLACAPNRHVRAGPAQAQLSPFGTAPPDKAKGRYVYLPIAVPLFHLQISEFRVFAYSLVVDTETTGLYSYSPEGLVTFSLNLYSVRGSKPSTTCFVAYPLGGRRCA